MFIKYGLNQLSMATLERILYAPVLATDAFIHFNRGDQHNLITDNSGSFLPVVWGTCTLNLVSDMLKKPIPFSEYVSPLLMTSLMTAIEVGQKYGIMPGAFDENDLYAGLLGGVASLTMSLTSKYLGRIKE